MEPHGPGGVVAAGRLAGERREPARHRPGDPRRRRGHRLDGGLERGAIINNGGKRWDATKLGQQLATDVFKTALPACGTAREYLRSSASRSRTARSARTVAAASVWPMASYSAGGVVADLDLLVEDAAVIVVGEDEPLVLDQAP